MEEQPFDSKFPSSEELIEYLREHSDDIEGVIIPVQPSIAIQSPEGRQFRKDNVGAMIKLCSGRSLLIHRDDAATLINDGVLQRMQIKCVLDPLDGSGGPA